MAKYLHSVDDTLIRARGDNGNTVLCLASQDSSKETVQWMIEEVKIDVNETSLGGLNCFHAAVLGGKIKTTEYLDSINPMLSQAQTINGETAWNFAVGIKSQTSVDYLIKRPFANQEAVIFDGEESCVVCYSAAPSLIFLPCKHNAVCKNCVETTYQEFEKCPVCRAEIKFVYSLEESDSKKKHTV